MGRAQGHLAELREATRPSGQVMGSMPASRQDKLQGRHTPSPRRNPVPAANRLLAGETLVPKEELLFQKSLCWGNYIILHSFISD
jgi:hypothetical protein